MRVVDLRPVLVLLAGVLVWAVAPPAPAQAEPAPAGTVEIELVEVTRATPGRAH